MKMRLLPLLAAVILAACADQSGTTGAAAPDARDAPAATEAPAAAAADERTAPGQGNVAQGKAAMATGTVESVDVAAGKIVIAHGPVEALQWPAMTMGFDATPALIQSVQPGQKIEFHFSSLGATNTIVHIQPME